MSGYVTVGASVLGRQAYEAYADSTGGRTFDDRLMPTWDELPERIKTAWNAAARRVAESVYAAVRAAEPCPETVRAPEGYPHD